MATARQETWAQAAAKAASEGNDAAAGLFALLSFPNDRERGHVCDGHIRGFRRGERRGFKCAICGDVKKWVDPS